MTAYLAANGARVTDLDLAIPFYGAPVADIALSTPVSLSGSVTLNVGNLALTMAVATRLDGTPAVATFAGVTTARLVGGAGKWRTPVSLAPYRAPPGTAGVLLSSVLSDLARAAGEKVKLASGLDRSLGPFFVPEGNAPASRILALLAGSLWWMDTSGVTQIAATRPTSSIGSLATVSHWDGGRGWVTVASEDPASWIPGASYSSKTASFTVAGTRIRAASEGTMRLEVLTS